MHGLDVEADISLRLEDILYSSTRTLTLQAAERELLEKLEATSSFRAREAVTGGKR